MTAIPRPPAKTKAAPRFDSKAKSNAKAKPRFNAEARPNAKAKPRFDAKAGPGAKTKPRFDAKDGARTKTSPRFDAKAGPDAKSKPRFDPRDSSRAKARPRFDAEARSNASDKPRYDAKAGPGAKAKPRFGTKPGSRPKAKPGFDTKADPRAAFRIKPTTKTFTPKAKPAPRPAVKNTPKPKADAQPRIEGKARTTPRVKVAKPKLSSAQALLKAAETILDDGKAENIVAIDLQGKSDIADYLLIATGNSQRQIAALSQHLITGLKAAGFGRIQSEGVRQGEWVLIDAGDVIVHLFRPEMRTHYNLEKMWGEGLAAVVGQD